MIDCMGKELHIGDKVICSDGQYSDLLIGEITGLTLKKAKINYVRSAFPDEPRKESLKYPYQIYKIGETYF